MCAFIKARIVLMAALMTLAICIAIFIYAMQTKSDFTT